VCVCIRCYVHANVETTRNCSNKSQTLAAYRKPKHILPTFASAVEFRFDLGPISSLQSQSSNLQKHA